MSSFDPGPSSEHSPEGPLDPAPGPATGPSDAPVPGPATGPQPGDLGVLEQLESQLAAVEAAMESLVAIAATPDPGDADVDQIRAVVNDERFPVVADDDAPSTGPVADGDPVSSAGPDPLD